MNNIWVLFPVKLLIYGVCLVPRTCVDIICMDNYFSIWNLSLKFVILGKLCSSVSKVVNKLLVKDLMAPSNNIIHGVTCSWVAPVTLFWLKRIWIYLLIGIFLFRYHLKDVIIGKIYFLLVRIKIKNMDLEIRRRESTGSGANTHVETETLAKFELMDGAPVRGALFPLLRTFLFIILFKKTVCQH